MDRVRRGVTVGIGLAGAERLADRYPAPLGQGAVLCPAGATKRGGRTAFDYGRTDAQAGGANLMRKFEAEPFTSEEDDALATKFDAWTQELTDRERRILGIAIAVSGARSVDASAVATTPLAGPQIAAILAAVAALVVTVGQMQSPDSTESKDREAGARDLLGTRRPGLDVPGKRKSTFGFAVADAASGRDVGSEDVDEALMLAGAEMKKAEQVIGVVETTQTLGELPQDAAARLVPLSDTLAAGDDDDPPR